MKRQCYHSDESYFDSKTGQYSLIRVVEDEAGYEVVRGYDTLNAARETARVLNEKFGLTDDEVLDIRVSSMAVSGGGN